MADVVFRVTAEDGGIEGLMTRILELGDQNVDKFDQIGDTATEAFEMTSKAIQDTDKQTKDYIKTQTESAAKTEQQAKTQNLFERALANTVGQLKIGGKTLNEYVDGLKAKQAALKATSAGLAATSKGLRVFRTALIATGIGAFVVVLGSLVAALTQTQKGIDAVNRVLAVGRSIFDNFIERASRLGGTLLNIFNQPLRQTINEIGESFAGLGSEIIADARAANELERASQSLRDRTREVNLEYERQRATIEELRNVGQDVTRSATERTQALQKALELETDITEKRAELAEENLRIIRERNALGNSLADDLQAEADAEAALAQIRQQSATQRREVAGQLNAIQQAELQRVQALRDAYKSLIDDLESRVSDAGLSSLLGIERLQRERELAIQEVNKFVDEITKAATAAGRDLPADFQDNVRALLDQVEQQFRRGVDELRKGDPLLDPVELLTGGDSGTDNNFEEVGKRLIEGIDRGARDNISILDRLKFNILDALNISEQELNFITESLGDAFGNVLQGIDSITQQQIDQQDQLISAIDNRISETQSLLDAELEKARQGYANDSEALQRKLQSDQEARTEAEQQRSELERRAARQRLIQNGLEQASNLVLAVTKLTAAEASKGLIGIVTAITGASLLFSLIAQARSQAQQFSEVPEFRDGTEYVHGPGGSRDDKVNARLSVGERVVDANSNARIGGESVSNADLVNGFLYGKQVENMFGGRIPITNLAPMLAESRANEQRIIQLKNEVQLNRLESAYRDAANNAASDMIAYWKSRPVEKIVNGKQVREWEQGGTVHRQSVSKK